MAIAKYRNPKKSYKIRDSELNPSDHLTALSKINIFVGPNNSGKSQFMRQIFADRFNHDEEGLIQIGRNDLVQIQKSLPAEMVRARFFVNDLEKVIQAPDNNTLVNDYRNFEGVLRKTLQKNGDTSRDGTSQKTVANHLISSFEASEALKSFKNIKFGVQKLIYVPILRGLRVFNGVRDIYLERTQLDYSLPKSDIFTGLDLYNEISRMKNGSAVERRNFESFIKFLEEEFFQGQRFELTPTHGSDVLHININNESEDKAIFNVGDGIQSVIIATFQAFKNQDEDTIIFIEEPELLMHPSMQRTLIEALIKRFPKLQVFMTTHSNHFLDLTYDYPEEVSIFAFEKAGENEFLVSNITDNSRILDLLGVRNSSVFLANAVIWTEGVTDRMLLRTLLGLETDFNFKEDKHYAFAEYGGSNLSNFSFVDSDDSELSHINSISKRNFLVADNDGREKAGEKQSLQDAKKVFSEEHFFAEHIEIENLIPFRIWVAVTELISQNRGYRFKKDYENNEEKFNKELNQKKIGVLIKEYLIEEEKSLEYFKNDDVRCLGVDKKTIMSHVVAEIEKQHIENDLTLKDFPENVEMLLSKIKKFIQEVN